MNKTLLLVFLWAVSTTLSLGQSGTNLNRATRFAVLASTQVTNNGTTTVTGDLGISPGTSDVPENNIIDSGTLTVIGAKDLSNTAAANAMLDAQASYDALRALPNPTTLTSPLGGFKTINPGVYRITGDAVLTGLLPLDAKGNPNATFVFIVDGNFTSSSNASILLLNGAQSQNIFWVVAGSTVLGSSTVFQGTILGKGDVTLNSNVGYTGRIISLEGAVNLNSNNILQPIQFSNDLTVEKSVADGNYLIGDEVTYTIKATNNGPTNAINVVVQESIPDGLELVRATPAKGTYDTATNQWTIASLSNEESTTLTLVFRITKPGSLENNVSISGEYNDPNNTNNTATVSITATCPAIPVISVTGNAEICNVTQDITYTVTEVEGATYAYTLPTGWVMVSENGNTITVRPTENGVSGKIMVTVTDQCGKFATGELDVVIVAVPATPVIEGTALICNINETYTYTATGVTENATYEWVAGGSFEIVSGQGTASVVVRATSIADGTIAVRALNNCNTPGESTQRTIKVSAAPEVPVINSTPDNTVVCQGSTVTYSITGVAGETYTWRLRGDIVLADGSDLTGENITVVVNGAGALFVTATNECSTSEEAMLEVTTIVTPATPSAITGAAAVCRESGNHTYSVVAVDGVTYKWNVPAGWTFTGDGTNSIVATAGEMAEAGNITVSAANKCGESAVSTLAVVINEKPAAPVVVGDLAACVSATQVTYTLSTIVSNETYAWSTQGNITIDGANDGSEVNVIVNGAGTLTVVATNGCGSATTSVTITPTEKLPAPANLRNSSAGEVCQDQQITLMVDAVEGASSYSWNVPADWTIVSTDVTTTSLVVIAKSTGDVSVVANNKCGPGAATTLTVNVTPKAAAATIKGDATACVDAVNTVTYSIDPVAGATSYIWRVAEGNLEIVGSNEGLQVSVLVRGAGRLEVTSMTNTCAGEIGSLSITPSVKPAAPGAITGAAAVCRESGNHTYSVVAVDGVTYKWSVPAGWTFTGDGTNSIVATAGEMAEAGNITVIANNKCGDSEATAFAVTLKEKPAAPSITGDATACIGTTAVTYSVAAVAGQTYTWRLTGDIAVANGSDLQGSDISVIISGAGSIFVAATNECGTGEEGMMQINPSTTLAAPANLRSNATGEICAGQQITFNIDAVDGAQSYSWNLPAGWTAVTNPANTTELVAIAGATGTVSVSAMNKCGAGAVSSMDVTVTPTPAAPVFTSQNIVPCNNASVTYSVAPVNGIAYTWTLTGNYTVGGDGDLEGNDITVMLNGPVTISVSGKSGTCPGPAATLMVNPTPAPATPGAVTGPAEVCANSTGNVYSVAEVAGATTYNWVLPTGWTITAGAGTRSITVTANTTGGNVAVEVSNTCFPAPIRSAARAVTISTPPAAVTAIMDNSTLCQGLAYNVNAVTGATTYTWSVPTGFTITSGQGTTAIRVRRDNDAATGNVTVTPSNTLGCAGAATSMKINTAILNGTLEFPKAFSPNGDGNNDTWVIKNLDQYAANEVVIFNRYGSEVYKKKNYQNDWAGNSLSQGTYFYKVKVTLCDGVTKEYTGYTTIFR